MARRQRKAFGTSWPIDETAGRTPDGWPGWPDGKKFALVLTHDIEGPEGLRKCQQLANLEMELGFRSSFNFIPEGSYAVPPDLRRWFVERGFEVGIHDLEHNGRLFDSRTGFRRKAARINRYLRDWEAAGFRSGFMLRDLGWLHELDLRYDLSTFDTDPFELQPQGIGTIFPFWIPSPALGAVSHNPFPNSTNHNAARSRGGYVELPYTLSQDSTLFLVLGETSPQIWLQKLDWIADRGGMALIDVHPDYIRFDGERPSPRTYPVAMYLDFLNHARRRYTDKFWHTLPREAAAFTLEHRDCLRLTGLPAGAQTGPRRTKIWIDLENTPHIPFFNPIIRELRRRGYEVVLTARDAYQTCEMADLYGFAYKRIGRHYGQNLALKAWGLFLRTLQLLPFVLRERPALGLNHGARAQTVLCNLLGMPSVTIMDYEHTAAPRLSRSRWGIYPEVVTAGQFSSSPTNRVLTYPGIKEDVYAPELKPDPAIVRQLQMENARVIVTVRPPATEAHYHRQESEVLFVHFMNRAVATPGVKVILLPRNKRQESQIRAEWPQWLDDSKVMIPDHVVEGMNLLWHSDLVVSGGGTMNREAAALGVPVYSIFRGTIGAVDRDLQAQGRLVLIESVQEVETKIALNARAKTAAPDPTPRPTLTAIVDHIESIIRSESARWRFRINQWLSP
jgi:uncharacterized protein